mmetsp:Transcript_66128/g.166776  ORF Transcript_66128/g.166776 Transcript_66128/m.166776 type:complete len:496 (+) Transcript_66128:175-1662(+)
MSEGDPVEAQALRSTQSDGSYGIVEQGKAVSEAAGSGLSQGGARRGIRDLPDLTDRLIQAGIYAEYIVFRNNYLKWRKGSAQGAEGELTASALQFQAQSDPNQFEYWYPTASIFKWRYTMAYWMSISYLIGSYLFTFNAAIEYFRPRGMGVITSEVPNFLGSCLFTLGTYIGYVKLINIATREEEEVTYFFPDCTGMLQRVEVSSVVGTVAYFVGAVFFNIATTATLLPPLTETLRLFVIELTNVLGSIGFVIGGLCELIHNDVFFGGTSWKDPVWWASIANFIGGANFLLGSLPGMTAPMNEGWGLQSFVYLNFMVGSALFIFSSCLMIIMWRANDFGLTLLNQLNFALRSGGVVGVSSSSANRDYVGLRMLMPEEAPSEDASVHKYSLRGAFFIMLYCWFAFVSVANTFFREQQFNHAEEARWLELILLVGMQVFVVVVVILVLVIHSVVAEVPEEQPYFCVLISTRCVLVMGAVVQTIWFVRFWLAYPASHI